MKAPKIDMSWEEVKMRARDRMPINILADLNGISLISMKDYIERMEEKTGEKIRWGSKHKEDHMNRKKYTYDKKEIIDRYINGEKPTAIARSIGIGPQIVHNILSEARRNGDIVKPETTPETNETSAETEAVPCNGYDASIIDSIKREISRLEQSIQESEIDLQEIRDNILAKKKVKADWERLLKKAGGIGT